MDRSESRCRHRPDCCLRQPPRRKRGVEKEGDETGKSGRISRRDGADQSEGRKRLRAVETTGEVARCHTTESKPAGSEQKPIGGPLHPAANITEESLIKHLRYGKHKQGREPG